MIFEIKLPFKNYPNFEKKWTYQHADFKYTIEEDYGDGPTDGYFDNFYYYEHDSLEKIEMEIVHKGDEFHIKVTGELDDPIDWKYGRAKYTINACLKLNEFNSYWTQ